MKYETYNNYNESNIDWIGLMPAEWNLIRLKFLADIVTGSTPSKNDDTYYKEGTFPWVKPDDLKGLTPIMNTNVLINEEGKRVSRIVPKDSILVCCIGSLGKIGISGTELATNQQINSLIPNNLLNNNFCKYMVIASSSEYDKFSNSNVVAIINKQQQGELNYPIPPLTEQKQIATYLDKKTAKIDETISKNKQLIDLLEEKRIALINQVVTKGLNPEAPMKDSGIEWIGEIPENWEIKNLKYVANLQTGTTPKKNIGISLEEGINWFTPGDFDNTYKLLDSNRYIKKEAIISNNISIYPPNSILMVCIGATIGKLGVTQDISYSNQQITAILPKQNKIHFKYLLYYLISKTEYIKETANFTTLPILNNQHLSAFEILSPPYAEQKQIANYIDNEVNNINQILSKIDKNISLLEEYKTSLIHHVVTGKIDVRGEEI